MSDDNFEKEFNILWKITDNNDYKMSLTDQQLRNKLYKI